MKEIKLLPTGRYMDGPEQGRTFAAHANSAPSVKVMYETYGGDYRQVIYEQKWWQYENGDWEVRYYMTDESAREYRMYHMPKGGTP